MMAAPARLCSATTLTKWVAFEQPLGHAERHHDGRQAERALPVASAPLQVPPRENQAAHQADGHDHARRNQRHHLVGAGRRRRRRARGARPRTDDLEVDRHTMVRRGLHAQPHAG
jgi:hypothetical protein